MKALANVVWSEGMYLGPHHFQRQSRYFEDSIQFALSSLWFAAYGLTGLELDAEALSNGTAALLHATGVFPDGLPFNIPEVDARPQPRRIADEFPSDRDATVLSLAIPSRTERGPNCALENGAARNHSGTRYQAETCLLPDENTGRDERPVAIGRKNLRLLLDTEASDGLVTLPLARITRDGSGHFSYDSTFAPPALQIGASPGLIGIVRRLIEMLDEKASTIRQSRGTSSSDFSAGDVANFWLLHAVNSAAAPLRHLVSVKRGHPEELFLELSRLASVLCAFKLNSHPRDLPLYDHRNLGECFQELDRHIREHLEVIVPANYLSIPLKAAGNYFYEGEILDQRCVGRSQWVLAIRAAMSEVELMAKTPQLIKICSPPFVRELVKRALPGLALKHLPAPPPALRPNLEKQYFSIGRTGPCWEHMAQMKRVGVYIPGEIPEPEAEILVILERS
ncbi:MAG TPA: type VI secretion system baseplate subunit TssK [Bryobacteraceae bacterium]|jgi:type VI secretion system protein ImpJ